MAGGWRPHPDKPQDERLLGEPGEINEYIKPNGERYETKIGDDGRAVIERHHTDHGTPDVHTNPHDHKIQWDSERGNPEFVKPHINYPDGDIPEIKAFKEVNKNMGKIIIGKDEDLNFESISDFKWCMKANGEVQFAYNEKSYSIVHPIDGILISEGYKPETEKLCKDADEVLEYMIDGVRLRDIIKEIKVVARTI